MAGLWYRSRIDCDVDGIDWSAVRCHSIARGINDFVSAGILGANFAPVIFDPRYFPWAWDEKQSILSKQDRRSLAIWVATKWPDWSLEDLGVRMAFTWLEVLNPGDHSKTLQILEEHYGLIRHSSRPASE